MKEYNAESIKVLEGLTAVRTRPSMYIGGISGQKSQGLFRICKEVIDNSLDEYLAGRNSKVVIVYNSKENVVCVIDHGNGIPTEKKKNGNYALTDAMTKLHAGGKFEEGAYSVSSGMHGVGIKATNALSEFLQIWSNSGNGWYTQRFERGIIKSEVKKDFPKKYKKYIGETGVVIEYRADDKIFTDNTKLDVSRLKKELNDIQYLCPKLKINLIVDDTFHKYCSEEGLKDMVYRESIVGKPFVFKSKTLEVALNWTKEEGCKISSFVNISYTINGGTHLDGLRRIISKSLRKYTNEKVETDDLFEGLVGAIHYKCKEPNFASQIKEQLTNVNATKEVMSQLEEPLRLYFDKNKSLTDGIIKYSEKMLKERSKLKDSKNLLRGIDKLTKSVKTIPDKFLDADRKKYKVENLELFLVEGDSAGGHFKYGREDYQGALKLRGKMINAAKYGADKLIGNSKGGGNKEIRDLITVLGCGILSKCDISKLRFNKLILLMDADVDGGHIVNLALAFIVNYIPELIKEGHVYVIDAPLFVGSSATYRAFGNTRNEIEIEMKEKGIKKYDILRLKGWGEVSADQLSELCLSPKTRKLVQLKWSEDSESTMNNVMGKDVAFRKEMLGIE